MRLCYIANPNSPHTRRWVNWFAEQGHQISLIADNRLAHPWQGITLVDVPTRFNLSVARYLIWAIWTRDFIHRWQPDILHAHRVSSAGWLGAFSGFHPFVVTPWGSDLYLHPQRSRLAGLLARLVLERADLVTADSSDLCQTAIRMGARSQAVHLIQWGVDLKRFYPGNAPQSLRDELRVGTAQVIFSPRGLSPIYNNESILRAYQLVRKSLPHTILLLRDFNTDERYRRHISQLIEQLELGGAVRWLGRVEPWERLADYYRLATVVVSVPLSDSTSVSLLEAMACGIPIVASDLPSTREWIQSGENGFLVPPCDFERLAESLVELLRDSSRRAQYAAASLAQVRARANQAVEMGKMLQLYETLLKS